MIDIALNDNGDIMFEEDYEQEEFLVLNFILSKSSSLQLNFYVDNTNDDEIDGEILQLNVLINIPKYNKKAILFSDEEYNEQAIKLRINTSIKDVLENGDMGSKIESYKHKMLSEKNLFERIEGEIKRCLNDIIPNADVKVEKHKTYYREFYNALKITVINKGKYYYYYL